MEILVEYTFSVCWITLNRPEVFNAFNKKMSLSLQNALKEAEQREDVRVISITGSGKAFSSGQDLAEASDPNGPSLEEILDKHYNPIIKQIANCEKPVIALINGVAAGAGANIALACDICIAKKSTNFIQAFSKIGLIPDSGGTFFLPKLIGYQKALALMLTGEKVSAEEAEKLNMIYKSVEDEHFDEYCEKFVKNLAQMPTKALVLTKKALLKSFENTLDQQLELEKKYQIECGNSFDFKEGVTAFLEKRKPEFKGE
ncbi:MAG: enoyl-CoA hydratase/isomerase family protein [Flavobacteriia bacterium]|nr:enoyl-CoA hydratase/isomerase family protein [Flavobacteriia bacterium]